MTWNKSVEQNTIHIIHYLIKANGVLNMLNGYYEFIKSGQKGFDCKTDPDNYKLSYP